MPPYKSGFCAIVGLPNVGKSTLLNSIIGTKISIVSPKPQTTRNRITGIKTLEDAQIVFIDTPGIYKPDNQLGRHMLRYAKESLKGIDVILFVIEPQRHFEQNQEILKDIAYAKTNTFLIINKIDLVPKPMILSEIKRYSELHDFTEIIPISALKNDGVDLLLSEIKKYLPYGEAIYPNDIITDSYERFMVSEIIREKVFLHTFEEIPYCSSVLVTDWIQRPDGILHIKATIFVEKDGQKAIVIGKAGQMLKSIGTSARHEIEQLLDCQVFLELWVKVKKHWRENANFLRTLGF